MRASAFLFLTLAIAIVALTCFFPCTLALAARSGPVLQYSPVNSKSVKSDQFQGVALTQTKIHGIAFRAIVHVTSISNQDEVATLLSLKSTTNQASVALVLAAAGDVLQLRINDGMTSHTYEISDGKNKFPMNLDVDIILSITPIGAGACWMDVYVNGIALPSTLTAITPANLKYDQFEFQKNFIGTTQLLQVYDRPVEEEEVKTLEKNPETTTGFIPDVPIESANTASTNCALFAFLSTFVAFFLF